MVFQKSPPNSCFFQSILFLNTSVDQYLPYSSSISLNSNTSIHHEAISSKSISASRLIFCLSFLRSPLQKLRLLVSSPISEALVVCYRTSAAWPDGESTSTANISCPIILYLLSANIHRKFIPSNTTQNVQVSRSIRVTTVELMLQYASKG